MRKRKTDEECLKEIIEAQGNKYKVLRLEIDNGRRYVIAICEKHGQFKLRLDHFRNGHGCKKCRDDKTRFMNQERSNVAKGEFKEKANKIHNWKYIYDKIDYINNRTNINVICPIHGNFNVTPSNHLKGRGCPECWKIKNKENQHQKMTKAGAEFETKARKIHCDKYDYSKVIYKGENSQVCIICPKHGEFLQTPHDHLSGCECKKCKSSHIENELRQFLEQNSIYFIEQANRNNLKWLNRQTLDFYLPDYKLAIECQGIQHFKNISYFGNEGSLESNIKRDLSKLKKCQDNGVRLLYYANLGIDYPYYVHEDKNELLNAITNNI